MFQKSRLHSHHGGPGDLRSVAQHCAAYTPSSLPQVLPSTRGYDLASSEPTPRHTLE